MPSVRRLSPSLTGALLVALLLSTAPAVAEAGMKDLQVERLSQVEISGRQARLDFVVRELAMAIAAPPGHSVSSLGMFEFEVSTDHRITFVHDDSDSGGTPWSDLSEDGVGSAIVYIPRVTFRKGLPWSFEVGGNAGWVGATRQFVVGGYGRWAVLDGWSKVPDAAIQVGYDGYIGNDQLNLGVFQLALSVGYTFQTSGSKNSSGTRFSPFGGYSFLMAHAQPVSEVEGIGVVSAWAKDAEAGVDPRDFRFNRFFGGMQIRTGQVQFRIAADVTGTRPGVGPLVAGVNLSLGARF